MGIVIWYAVKWKVEILTNNKIKYFTSFYKQDGDKYYILCMYEALNFMIFVYNYDFTLPITPKNVWNKTRALLTQSSTVTPLLHTDGSNFFKNNHFHKIFQKILLQ